MFGSAAGDPSRGGGEPDLYTKNRAFYDSLWRRVRFRRPEWFDTWREVAEMIAGKQRILEVGPGMRPRLPLERAYFADLSAIALRKLKAEGARAVLANLVALPFPAESFDLVCAFDVMEHAPEQARAFAEVARTLRPGGLFLLAVPLRPELWTTFDQAVGHHLRYDRAVLSGLIAGSGFKVLRCAGFGLLPRHRALIRLGSWCLQRLPGPATWFEDRMALPIARRLAPRRRWVSGFAVRPGTSGALFLLEREKSVAKVEVGQETRGLRDGIEGGRGHVH